MLQACASAHCPVHMVTGSCEGVKLLIPVNPFDIQLNLFLFKLSTAFNPGPQLTTIPVAMTA